VLIGSLSPGSARIASEPTVFRFVSIPIATKRPVGLPGALGTRAVLDHCVDRLNISLPRSLAPARSSKPSGAGGSVRSVADRLHRNLRVARRFRGVVDQPEDERERDGEGGRTKIGLSPLPSGRRRYGNSSRRRSRGGRRRSRSDCWRIGISVSALLPFRPLRSGFDEPSGSSARTGRVFTPGVFTGTSPPPHPPRTRRRASKRN